MAHKLNERWYAVALAAYSLSSAMASAQAPAPDPPNASTPATSTPPDPRQDPRSTGSIRPGETLSERLDRTDGVLRPAPNIAPDNAFRPPDTGTTPVIPPPGSPGGDPRIIPK